MTDDEIRQQAREMIAAYLRLHTREGDCTCEQHQELMYELADELLALTNDEGRRILEIRHPDQTSPELYLNQVDWKELKGGYEDAVKDMKALGWVRVVQPVERCPSCGQNVLAPALHSCPLRIHRLK